MTRKGPQIGERILFLGIVAEAHVRQGDGHIEVARRRPRIKTEEMLDLGVVYKSSCVLETVRDYLAKQGAL